MPKGSEELTNTRKEEIINACASLYETMGFKDITIRDIGEKTSFTRTSIYNYFQTKEGEFFWLCSSGSMRPGLGIWRGLSGRKVSLSAEAFADPLARTLEKRGFMLKLMSMNLYDMEGNSRIENLVAFKRVYAGAIEAITRCLGKFFPRMTARDVQEFLYALLPFLFGIYPYTTATDKQREAMEIAHISYVPFSIYEITKPFVIKVLQFFQ